jgi:CDP-glycerol glycerophosphotransferase (TagB/SpsB family)
VLYAPTWEGWNRQQDYSSVATHGIELVRAVLAHPQRIRLVYRPHPYTGQRDARIAQAHRRIIELLSAANRAAGLPAPTALPPAHPSRSGDSARATEERAVAEGEERLAALDPEAHVVVRPAILPLVSCFNAATGLVTDVSSVLSDFLASGKPVAICDPTDGDQGTFRAAFPAAAAGPVLASTGEGLADFLDVVTWIVPDCTVDERGKVREFLLGSADVPAMERFGAAVAALSARASTGQAR